MYLKPLPPLPEHRETTNTFLGYNHNLRNRNGEFYEMENMTSDHFPLLSPRRNRGTYKQAENPQGMIAKSALVYIDGTSVVVDGASIDMALSTAPEDCPKDLIGMGAYVIIMPDKKYINTLNVGDRGSIDASFTSTGTVTFEPCNILGEPFSNVTVSVTAPDAPKDGELWIDTSESVHVMKKYTVTTKVWVIIPQTYIKITATGIGNDFSAGDGIRLSGITASGLSDLNSSLVIQEKGDNWIVVGGLADGKVTQSDAITMTRKMPKVDYVTESNNRLWACRYGTANNGQIVNEIYASKLGDFKNWECYEGISTDSYTVSVGSDGPFTGCVTQRNTPIFYKETCKHKIFGSSPASFGLVTVNCEGVGLGNSRSVAVVNELVYYMSANAVCVDDGGPIPRQISEVFGAARYKNGVGGAAGSKYFLSCEGEDGKWNAFVYDSERGLWHREDSTRAMAIESYRNDVYYIDADTKIIHTMMGGGIEDETPVHWMVETGLIGTDTPDYKRITRLDMRMMLNPGSRVRIFIQYDSIGDWVFAGNMSTSTLRSFAVPIRLRRCDHFRIRLEGEGMAMIHNMVRTIEEVF